MAFEFILAYAFLINLFSFSQMFLDKKKAIRGTWRIPEKRFFLLSIIGGAIGIILAMKVYRHKTRHISFTIGIPLILLIQTVLIVYFQS